MSAWTCPVVNHVYTSSGADGYKSRDDGSWSRAGGSQKSENFGRPYHTQNLSKSGVWGVSGIYRKCRCQKTPQTPDSDKFWVRYGLQKFFSLKTHVGGRRRVASRDDASRSRDDGSWSRADGSQKSENFGRPYLTQNLSKLGVWGVFWHL